MTRARDLADLISSGVIEATELADNGQSQTGGTVTNAGLTAASPFGANGYTVS